VSGLRVIAGKARGRRLRSVPGESTRPITDRTKESLFNILGADVRDSTWLDLFAGTGSVGIEALSRGAVFVRFVDIERLAIETIRANLKTTGLETSAEVTRQDAFALLARPADRRFDYVYVAPPQYKELWKRAARTGKSDRARTTQIRQHLIDLLRAKCYRRQSKAPAGLKDGKRRSLNATRTNPP
jgi:16S rRNA (guanine(966)-N(2))-methyltransferase RsmD